MALIKCPKCGGAVSFAADRCVHCGYRFIVCPDCGRTVAADAQSCSYCGRKLLARQPEKTPEEILKETKAKKEAEALKIRSSRDGAKYKKYNLGETICRWGISCFDFLWLAGLIIVGIFGNNVSDAVQEALAIVFLIFMFGSAIPVSIFSLLKMRLSYNCAQWIKREQYDIRSYLKANKPQEIKKRETLEVVSYAAFMIDRPKEKTFLLVKCVVPLALYALALFSVLIAVIAYDELILLGMFVWALGAVAYGIMERISLKHYNNWSWQVKENFRREVNGDKTHS